MWHLDGVHQFLHAVSYNCSYPDLIVNNYPSILEWKASSETIWHNQQTFQHRTVRGLICKDKSFYIPKRDTNNITISALVPEWNYSLKFLQLKDLVCGSSLLTMDLSSLEMCPMWNCDSSSLVHQATWPTSFTVPDWVSVAANPDHFEPQVVHGWSRKGHNVVEQY